MKLYYVPSACSLAAHVTLEWCDATYDAVRTHFGDKVHFDLNPIGTVGILDRGPGSDPLSQTPAILRYLARLYPDADIGDDGSIDNAAELDRWLSFLVSDVHHAFHLLFNPGRYAIDENEAAREAALAICLRNFKVLDDHLDGQRYMLGNRKSILDAYLFPMIRWSFVKFPRNEHTFKNIYALHDRLMADEGVRKAMRDEGIL